MTSLQNRSASSLGIWLKTSAYIPRNNTLFAVSFADVSSGSSSMVNPSFGGLSRQKPKAITGQGLTASLHNSKLCYTATKCLITRRFGVKSPRQSAAFFASIASTDEFFRPTTLLLSNEVDVGVNNLGSARREVLPLSPPTSVEAIDAKKAAD